MSHYRWPQRLLVYLVILALLSHDLAPVAPLLVPGSPAAAQAATSEPAAPAPAQPLSLAERPASAPNTIEVNAGGITPDLLQVPVNQAVTFVNNDTRTRSLKLSTSMLGLAFSLYLPLIQRGGSSSASRAPLQTGDETLTLAPGQSAQRTYIQAGNVYVSDAANPAITATVLVTPAPLVKSGSVTGTLKNYQTKAPLAGARVSALGTQYQTTTDGQGNYSLQLPSGSYTLTLFANGFTFANRVVEVQPFGPLSVAAIELVPLDTVVTSIGAGGGTAVNAPNTTNVVFASGAVASTKAARLTELPVDEFTADFEALPGPFTDGKIPLGFVAFEPDGTLFTGPVTWTIDYTGTLPVGAYVPCYYWLESEARWAEPVNGFVVDLGGGKKGLRAVLPHFSSYGFAAAPPPGPKQPVAPPPPDFDGPENNPSHPLHDCLAGSQLNLMSGELCQRVGTLGLPTLGALPMQVTAKYNSLDIAHRSVVSTSFGLAPGSALPFTRTWRFEIAGRTYTGTGDNVYLEWDGKDVNGSVLPPGAYGGSLTSRYAFTVTRAANTGGPGGQPVNCAPPSCGISIFKTAVPWTLNAARPDLSPFGLGWFSPHDMLLVDRGSFVTIVQGDGRQVNFIRAGAAYVASRGEFSTLSHAGDGTWTRAFTNGDTHRFDADGRLTKVADRYGHVQTLLYEANGKSFPAGAWGLTTRIRRIMDTGGNSFDFAYDANGWLASITDGTGRVYGFEHDTPGRLTATTDPLGRRETFTYDSRNLMTGHTDKQGSITSYTLDDRGRVLNRTWPTGTSLAMSYAGTRVNLTTDRGTPLNTTLDRNFNPVSLYNGVFTTSTAFNAQSQIEADSFALRGEAYDARGYLVESLGTVRVQYQRGGAYDQISQVTAGDGSDRQYAHDASGNVTSFTDALGQTYSFTYDTHGQPLTLGDPLGHVTAFQYDGRGQITRITDPLSRSFDMTYDAHGNRLSVKDPLNRIASREYDALNRLTAMVDALAGRTTLAYDANGTLTRFTDATGRAITSTYDVLNRLTSVTQPDAGLTSYRYDASGELMGITDPRGFTQTLAYDAAGRRTRMLLQGGPAISYGYDNLNQPTSLGDGVLTTTLSYLRDTRGRPLRQQQVATGLPLSATMQYQYSGGRVRSDGTAPLGAAAPAADTRIAPRAGAPDRPAAPHVLTCSETLSGSLSTSRTLTDTAKIYCFAANATIQSGATLTVAAGVTLAAGDSTDLTVSGTLALAGAPGNPAVLTSISEAPPNGATVEYMLNVQSGRLDWQYAEMRYAGHSGTGCDTFITTHPPALSLYGSASGVIANSKVGVGGISRALGVYNDTVLTVSDSALGDRANLCGPLLADTTGALNVSNTLFLGGTPGFSFTGDESFNVVVGQANVAGVINHGNVFSTTTGANTWLFVASNSQPITTATTWPGNATVGLDGMILRRLEILAGATLSVNGPWAFNGAWIVVGSPSDPSAPITGTLRLLGTAAQRIHITAGVFNAAQIEANAASVVDLQHTDLHGPSANLLIRPPNGRASLLDTNIYDSQDSYGIVVANGSLTVQDSAIYNNCGGILAGGLATVTVKFSTIRDNKSCWNVDHAGYGMSILDLQVPVVVTSTNFYGNAAGGIYFSTGTSPVAPIVATENYWGAASGPLTTTNPLGAGQSVDGNVQYVPWSPGYMLPGDGRLSSVQFTSNDNRPQAQTFAYDKIGRLTALASTGYSTYTLAYAYDTASRLLARAPTQGGVPRTAFGYDAANQLTSLALSSTTNLLLGEQYGYDLAGNLSSISSSRDGAIAYGYDALNRLSSITSTAFSANYGYDGAGNRTSAGAVTYSYDAGGRLASASDGTTYAYDLAGSLTGKTTAGQTTTYTWVVQNRLARIDYPNGTFGTYQYDGAGRRISKRQPDGTTIYFIYSGDLLMQELDAGGGVLASYAYDKLDHPISLWRGGQTYYYLLDRLGSVLGLADEAANVVASYRYDPWGNLLASTGTLANPLRFTAREFDVESGLYFYRARYYDPQAARFLSRDPLGVMAGTNLYAYVANQPSRFVDPLGLQGTGGLGYPGAGPGQGPEGNPDTGQCKVGEHPDNPTGPSCPADSPASGPPKTGYDESGTWFTSVTCLPEVPGWDWLNAIMDRIRQITPVLERPGTGGGGVRG